MTQYPPAFNPDDRSGYDQRQYGYSQQQQSYSSESGSYHSGGPQGQYDQQHQPPQQQYGSYQQTQSHQGPPQSQRPGGHAQSYYNNSDQPYQSYNAPQSPPAQGYNSGNYYNGPPQELYPPRPEHQPYGSQPPAHPSTQGYDQHPPPYGGYGNPEGGSYNSPADPTYSQPRVEPSNYHPGANPPPQDRGLLGALAGGAAGAYAGHKLHHGIIGTLGGAYAGHKLEDALKDKKNKKKKDKASKKDRKSSRGRSHSRSSSSSSSSSDSSRSRSRSRHGHPSSSSSRAVVAGNFHSSSHSVHLENGHVLVAECGSLHGHYERSYLDLNDCFTNEGGELRWQRNGNFAASARNISLVDDGRVLEAELGDGRGGWRWQRVDLNERVSNEDGRLVLL